MIGVFAGSFDPITVGHTDIIRRSVRLVDKLYIAMLDNTTKQYLFHREQRLALIRCAVAEIPNVEVDYFHGLLADYIAQKGIDCIIRGVRNTTDFEYERDIAYCNRKLSGVETLFLPTSQEFSFVSASIVRELYRFHGDISAFVDQCVLDKIAEFK